MSSSVNFRYSTARPQIQARRQRRDDTARLRWGQVRSAVGRGRRRKRDGVAPDDICLVCGARRTRFARSVGYFASFFGRTGVAVPVSFPNYPRASGMAGTASRLESKPLISFGSEGLRRSLERKRLCPCDLGLPARWTMMQSPSGGASRRGRESSQLASARGR